MCARLAKLIRLRKLISRHYLDSLKQTLAEPKYMMQPSHQDPSLRYARSLMKNAQHQLWWRPGVPGRGFVQQSNGIVHTWPEVEGSHLQMAHAKGIPWPDVEHSSFITRPDGTTVFPYARSKSTMNMDQRAAFEQQLMQQVSGASSRLNPVQYDPLAGIAQAYARTADYYHVAPTTERNRIMQHGLQPSQPMNNPDWGPQSYWNDRHGPEGVPEGVYVWNKPGQAYQYTQGLETARDTPMDVWRIPGEHQMFEDPDVPWAHGIPHPVMNAELHEGPEHRINDNFGLPYENQWNNYKPLNLNLRNNADYEELWHQRVGD